MRAEILLNCWGCCVRTKCSTQLCCVQMPYGIDDGQLDEIALSMSDVIMVPFEMGKTVLLRRASDLCDRILKPGGQAAMASSGTNFSVRADYRVAEVALLGALSGSQASVQPDSIGCASVGLTSVRAGPLRCTMVIGDRKSVV